MKSKFEYIKISNSIKVILLILFLFVHFASNLFQSIAFILLIINILIRFFIFSREKIDMKKILLGNNIIKYSRLGYFIFGVYFLWMIEYQQYELHDFDVLLVGFCLGLCFIIDFRVEITKINTDDSVLDN